jgi:hypothetical protein
MEKYGFPVVNPENIFSVLEKYGIKPWPQAKPTVDLEDYLKEDLDEDQKKELRFAPKSEVVSLLDPSNQLFRGFRSVGKDWATTFVLLPGDLVPIVCEYKHGVGQVVVVPPSGVPNKEDQLTDDPMLACAAREWEEETGLRLSSIESLSRHPLVINGRQSTHRYYPFLGYVKEPITKLPSKLDHTECLKVVLMALPEWLKFIQSGAGVEDCAASITLLALYRLGYI